MSSDLITLEYDGPVAILSNNRPDKHNAANDAMDTRLWEVLAELHQRDGLRAAIWRGNGKSFSSGRDTSELGVRSEDISDFDFIERGHKGAQQFFSMPCPILVALHGWTIGGSFERALLCDMRIASESARMMLPEIMHGVVPDSGGTARLFQMAGHGLTADLALTGRVLDAQEALRHGIVSRVVPDDQLEDEARKLADEMLLTSPNGLRLTKECLNASLDAGSLEQAIAMEDRNQVLCSTSPDLMEGVRAFLEKRPPEYKDV